MSALISLAELRSALLAESLKHVQRLHPNGDVHCDVIEDHAGKTIAWGSDGEEADFVEATARGVVAAVNASPVLLEIAAAALAWRTVDCDDKVAAEAVVIRMIAALAKVCP